jgi:D-alanine-D-alanine ligase
MIPNEYFSDIKYGLKSICNNFTHYNSPKQLIDNIQKHKSSIVFTIYGGSESRNRMALVPAICESYGIKYVGADTYARIVCQDKYLSKIIANRHKIKTAKSVLIDKISRLPLVKELELPIVVKPNLEGSSIGISDASLIKTHADAIIYARELLIKFKQPILIEEFITGREICICIIGSTNSIDLFEAMEVHYESNISHFYNKLYTAHDKHISEDNIVHSQCTELLSAQEIIAIKELYFSLGKMDFMRIDGRINIDGFTLIELTPDAFIGKKSSIADAGKINGISYSKILEKIINNALEYYHTPYSSYLKS